MQHFRWLQSCAAFSLFAEESKGMEAVASFVFAGAVGLVFAEALKSPTSCARECPVLEYDEYENVLNEHSLANRSFASNESPFDGILSWISFRMRGSSSFIPFRFSSGHGFRRACRRLTSKLLDRARLGLRNRKKNSHKMANVQE